MMTRDEHGPARPSRHMPGAGIKAPGFGLFFPFLRFPCSLSPLLSLFLLRFSAPKVNLMY